MDWICFMTCSLLASVLSSFSCSRELAVSWMNGFDDSSFLPAVQEPSPQFMIRAAPAMYCALPEWFITDIPRRDCSELVTAVKIANAACSLLQGPAATKQWKTVWRGQTEVVCAWVYGVWPAPQRWSGILHPLHE